MKRAVALIAVLLIGVALATSPFIYQSGWRAHDASIRPDVLSDRDARERLATTGIAVPPSATDLYFFNAQFRDQEVFISMTLPPDEGWTLVEQATGVGESSFEVVDDTHVLDGIEGPASYGSEFASDQWTFDDAALPQVVRIDDGENDHGRYVIYYPETGRLMIYDWSY